MKNLFINPLALISKGSAIGGSGVLGGATPTNITFTFPNIIDKNTQGHDQLMKNISPSILPNFKGISSEDPDQFLFEFKVICRTYDYETDA